MTLSEQQIERWARQIILPEVGGRGQARLLGASAAVASRSLTWPRPPTSGRMIWRAQRSICRSSSVIR